MRSRLALPLAFAVAQFSAACRDSSAPDASTLDAQPPACAPIVLLGGAVQCVGGGSDQFCVSLTTCSVDDAGVPSDTCCELVG